MTEDGNEPDLVGGPRLEKPVDDHGVCPMRGIETAAIDSDPHRGSSEHFEEPRGPSSAAPHVTYLGPV